MMRRFCCFVDVSLMRMPEVEREQILFERKEAENAKKFGAGSAKQSLVLVCFLMVRVS